MDQPSPSASDPQGSLDGLEGAAFDAALAELAKGLAHPARVAILRMLMSLDGCFVGDIVSELPLAQSTISQHLRKLKQAGLVKGEIEGPRTCYCVDPEGIERLERLLAELLSSSSGRALSAALVYDTREV